MDQYVDRSEFDGLDKRVAELDKSVAACQAERGAQIQHIQSSLVGVNANTTKLFEGQEQIRVSMASMISKIIGGTAIVYAAIQAAVALLPKLIP